MLPAFGGELGRDAAHQLAADLSTRRRADVAASLNRAHCLRQILQAVTRPSAPGASTLSRVDRKRLGGLLPAVAGVLGSEPFLVRDLFELPAPGLRLVLGDLTTKQVGRLLARGTRRAVDDLLVQRDGTELNTTLWRIVRVQGFPGKRSPGCS